ncbi:uncharacterized protein LOC129227727 [Uloborus diversus]|uniref:uncharacterized protein LOC129227727 n=1 Tax=Uloborus diversus TaxID=327109 RepID=UPI0024097C3D|nr:uncharacterized protein LOC129227727 [Uloborus diversus]XP_054718306.1 uncharacterized protein LOC129227727 [Uloborus diversus]
MNPSMLRLLFTVAIAVNKIKALDVSVKGDGCSTFDRCTIKDIFRTCSCDTDCHEYGTCCVDAESFPLMSANEMKYFCSSEQVTTPVFSKRSCSKDFKGHVETIGACSDQDRDPGDMMGNLLITSSKTKITYANKNCAICNNEMDENLHYWTIEVSCPARFRELSFNQKYIRNFLTLNESLGKWGLKVNDSFVSCSFLFYQPNDVYGKLKYCAPNMISQCPRNYTDNAVSKMCGYYYGERKEKNSNVYYKNAHCALCNGVSLKEVDCVGRTYAPVESDENPEAVKVVFSRGFWLEREGKEKFKCSENFSYDPFQKRCRRFLEEQTEAKLVNSAALRFIHLALFIASVLIHF